MLLAGKNAVVYGASGWVGAAVARGFAREGARVFLAGRRLSPLEAVAQSLREAGGRAECVPVDALDAESLQDHAASIDRQAGGIDIAFNAVALGDVQGVPLTEISLEHFFRPIEIATKAQLLIARAVAPVMIRKGSGVLMAITAVPARMAFPLVGGFGVAGAALEGLCRGLAAELGPHGVRVNCLCSAGSPESILETMDDHAVGNQMSRDQFIGALRDRTMLKQLPTLNDVAEVAAWLASDRAAAMTGAVVNVTCGMLAD